MPLLLRPFADSPERLVLGIAAVSKDDFHLECANSLERLECLLAGKASEVIEVARLALRSFEKQLAEHGLLIGREFRAPVSGVMIGNPQDAAGISLVEICEFWLAATSSLHDNNRREIFSSDQNVALYNKTTESKKAPAAEVIRKVLAEKPSLISNFRPHFIRAKRLPAHQNDVDYKSESIVANIDFMAPNFRAQTVNRIVKRMWDLEIDRGSNDNAPSDSHEMLVEVPQRDEMSRRDADRLNETVEQLTWQADQRRIRFRPLHSTEEISARILQAEAA
ncbi:hypothetical protein ACFPH9_13625 [Brevundimonas bullata]